MKDGEYIPRGETSRDYENTVYAYIERITGVSSGLLMEDINSTPVKEKVEHFTYFPKPINGKWRTVYSILTLSARTEADVKAAEQKAEATREKVFAEAARKGRWGGTTATSRREEKLRKARLEKLKQRESK